MRSLAYELSVTCVALMVVGACGEAHKAAPESVEWAGHKLREVTTLSELPPTLQAALGVGRAGLEGIADRGRKFNITDVVVDDRPMRRFVVAGIEGDTALIAIERGGFGHFLEVTLFSDSNRRPTVEHKWSLPGADVPQTVHALTNALAQTTPVR